MKNQKNTNPAESQGTEALRRQIGLRAYHIWLASGGSHGNDLQHWLQAEKEIGDAHSNPDSLKPSTV